MIMYPINFHHKINGGFQQGLHFRHFLFFFVCHLLFQVFLMFVCPLVFAFPAFMMIEPQQQVIFCLWDLIISSFFLS